MSLILTLVIGGIAGWLAGKIMRGGGFGVLMNVVIGVVGSFVGALIFRLLGLGATNVLGSLIAATVGAVVVIWVADYVGGRRDRTTAP
jgi:uncharacterized membrane protein YeaQ/YmgE (transglycosylase-associated protein family)